MRLKGILAATLGIAAAQSGALPEPAAWVMLLAGCGLFGIALRRRPAQRIRFV
ncbi:MAG: PEPxxWA-CTERM sorting domain-containing protein [Sphingomonas sp.]